jgi:hypothetical protein
MKEVYAEGSRVQGQTGLHSEILSQISKQTPKRAEFRLKNKV